MSIPHADIVVAGHTCVDLIPVLRPDQANLPELLIPGHLLNVGPMMLSTGGAAPNTGLALHRLGTAVRIVGRIGDDALGRAVIETVERYDRHLSTYLRTSPGEAGAYTLIFSAPGLDRTFLHFPGPNDTFGPEDISQDVLKSARIFHFGYPTLMKRMYSQEGRELEALLLKVKEAGLALSLDVSLPDPASDAGRADWRAILRRVLPHTDIFLPSLDEILFMLRPGQYTAASRSDRNTLAEVDERVLGSLAGELIELGVAAVGIKLGSQGMLLQTSNSRRAWKRLASILPLDAKAWRNRQVLAPAFAANLVGTTGAGDCANAGFLMALLRGYPPERALTSSVAVGGCSVEAADAVGGVPSWDQVQARIDAGWQRLPTTLRLKGWGWDSARGLWFGPRDRGGLWCGN